MPRTKESRPARRRRLTTPAGMKAAALLQQERRALGDGGSWICGRWFTASKQIRLEALRGFPNKTIDALDGCTHALTRWPDGGRGKAAGSGARHTRSRPDSARWPSQPSPWPKIRTDFLPPLQVGFSGGLRHLCGIPLPHPLTTHKALRYSPPAAGLPPPDPAVPILQALPGADDGSPSHGSAACPGQTASRGWRMPARRPGGNIRAQTVRARASRTVHPIPQCRPRPSGPPSLPTPATLPHVWPRKAPKSPPTPKHARTSRNAPEGPLAPTPAGPLFAPERSLPPSALNSVHYLETNVHGSARPLPESLPPGKPKPAPGTRSLLVAAGNAWRDPSAAWILDQRAGARPGRPGVDGCQPDAPRAFRPVWI